MFVGIVSANFIAANFHLFDTFMLTERTLMSQIFATTAPGAFLGIFNRWHASIIIFIVGLGMITSMVVLSGGARALVRGVGKSVKTRKGVQYLSVLTGIALMIDDYFNAMVNGTIAKTLGDRHRVSRARTSYIVDSIAAPICIAAPVSSWAVAIMGNMNIAYEAIGVYYARNIFIDFLLMIPYHFYVFAAIGMVLITIKWDFNIMSMKSFQEKFHETGTDDAADLTAEGLLSGAQSEKGTVWDFWGPIITLFVFTVAGMFITGIQGAIANDAFGGELLWLFTVFDNWSLSISLAFGGIAGIVASLIVGARHVRLGTVTKEQVRRSAIAGPRSMLGATCILILSWTIASSVGYLRLGDFVSELLYNVPAGLIPFIMFVAAALLAFAIGTSWGTFALVLPIAATVIHQTDNMHLLLPAMSAVLSGAVWGDHSSPISDTTILAAAGTTCKTVDHWRSQMPYAIIAALIAAIGYLGFGLGGMANAALGYILGYALLIVAFVVMAVIAKSQQKPVVPYTPVD
jgi:Na+/H+ antiporter NhaC